MTSFKALGTYEGTYDRRALVAPEYANEVGKSGERKLALQNVEMALVAAFAAAREKQLANRTPQVANLVGNVGRVSQLIGFHQGQMAEKRSLDQETLNNNVITLRKWLSRQGAWVAGIDGKLQMETSMKLTVMHDSLAGQNATKVSFLNGRLFTTGNQLLDTAKMVTQFSGPGKAIYVMSASGNLHLHSHSVGHYHHSSLLAGAPVACAGEVEVKEGRITYLSNKSGHYTPDRRHLLQVLAMLQEKGVDLNFPITVIGTGGRTMYKSVGAFMKAQELDDETFERMKALAAAAARIEAKGSIQGGCG